MGSFASARVTSSAVGGSWDEVTPRAKAITAAVAALAVVGIVKLRFCGDLTLPAKPPAPLARTGDLNQALAGTAANDDTWRMFLTRDAAAAGLGTIDPTDMTRVFPYQGDSARHVLAPGESIELAGLKLTASAEPVPDVGGGRRPDGVADHRRHGPGGGAIVRAIRGRVLRSGSLGSALLAPRGAVLLVEAVTPALAIMLGEAAALVSDTGGALDHGAALARERGLPALVGCTGAWHGLSDGELVELDVVAGTLRRV